MGVPKFYRWISERYPCLSEVVKEFQIPEFDNLYLDMNGIIHVCSHPDDGNPHFRITEEKIFRDIFHYLEFLFRMIKPRKVFFMAIDGVAPRAKMNQQRGRRFRSAREAEELERKARESGEVLPTEKRFDSNCITPGTEFMVRLQEQLKYFVTSKISNDPLWHAVDVYLSGHETPGEGEHKIMDFIRQQKSEPSYDPNTRHCLYGLDADLIMLGLTSHEPHFSLLREEVRFGGHKDKNKRPATPEETTFHLLHLSLMREYLDFEFESLKDSLPFGYDLEKIIDDWVLMGFLVGNDFIPHLPHLHIQHDALPLLWKTYMNILPECGGYLNDGGHLNLERFEQYMKELAKFDIDKFEETFSDLKWLETKIEGKAVNMEAANVADEIKARKMRKENANKFAALQDTEEDGLGDEFLPTSQKVSAATTPITPDTPDSDDEDDINTFDEEFTLHKKHYYMTKMEYENVDKEVLRDQSEGYIRAIQWILLYYYEGVPSWSWFYPHHYAPYISDVTDFKDMNIEFDLSTPFLPFQQLMAVLPAASKELLPEPYQKLMTQDYSPVIDFYPVNFQTDLNGKQQDWEAVVLIPFIDENRLLDAMRTVESKLSDPEKKRNSHGPCLLYNYSKEELEPYPSSLPGVFPDIVINHARLTKIPLDAFLVDKKKLWKGLLPGVKLDVYFPGFPTLKHLPHRAFLKKDGVKVFQHCSKNENMLLEILSEDEQVPSLSTVASEYVGKTIYVAWPHLYEAKVISVADREERFVLVEESGHKSGKSKRETKYNIQREPLGEDSAAIWCSQIKSLTDRYKDRLGIIVGDTYYILNVQPMIGRKYICGSHGVITHEKQFSKDTVPFLLQTTVKDIAVHDPAFCQFKMLRELFPVKEMVFMLGWPHYGGQGEVMDTEEGESPRVRINVIIPEEPKLDKFAYNSERYSQQFFPGYIAAQRAGISSHFLSRITGSIFVKPGSADNPQEGHNINIGLNMKFTKRSEEMPGYTKQTTDGWTYSQKAISTVSEYMQRFPEIVEYISNNDRNKGDVFYEEDLFGDTGVTLKQVQDYLKSLPIAQIKTQKTGTDNLDEGIIKAIEQEVDRVQDINRKGKRVKMQVKPHLLFRPIIGQGGQVPDLSAKYYLFDRVVNVRNGYSVPFGLRGTVVGIHKGEKESDVIYEVVFDEVFQGGLTIRCSEGRGYRVPPAALINITYGERKNGARADPVASQQNSYERTQNYHTSQPQYPRQGSYNQNAWQQGQSSRGYNEAVTNDYNRQGSYSNFKNRNDNRAFYNENFHNDYDEDYNYAGYDTSNRKRQQYDKNVHVRSPRGKNQHDKNPGVMGSPRGNQQNQRQTPKESVHKHPGADENQPDKPKTTATKPDSLNLRQQSFDGSESAAPPMFVTPKISPGRRDPRRDSGGGGQSKIYHDSHNSEFANMWKELQTGANESGKAPSGGKDENKGPTLLQAAESLPKVPSPVVNHSETVESKREVQEEKKTVTLDSLFKEASKVKSEEDQFAAMFKSLQISAEKKEETTTKPAQNHGIVEESTNALKQMLKIGSEDNGITDSGMKDSGKKDGDKNDSGVKDVTEEVTSEPSKTYGRQVSLQELFEGVKGQLPATNTVAPAQIHKSPPQGAGGGGHPTVSPTKQAPAAHQYRGAPPQNRFSKPHQKSQQPPHQPQQPGGLNRFPGHHKRNPVMELKNWCQTMGLREPKYDFFGQPGTFACVVTLSNGARFQGSVTRTQEEAAESAAGATLLHVGAFRGPPVHPLMGGAMPQFPPPPSRQPSPRQQAPPRQFSSPNSAFKPVSAVLNGPYPYPNQYPNQRHYSQPPQNQYNQPNQFNNPRYTNQYEDRRGQQQPTNQNNRYNNRSAGKRQSQEKLNDRQTENSKEDERGKDDVTEKHAQSNPFIPMQVTRKTPQKRRDSESESRSVNPTETKSHKSQDKEVKSVVRNILPENTVTVNHSDKSEHVRNDVSCDEATLQTSNNKQTEEVKTPSKSERHVKEGSHTPSNKQPGKRRTRIAANFNFGGN